jgi:hypothetical protein
MVGRNVKSVVAEVVSHGQYGTANAYECIVTLSDERGTTTDSLRLHLPWNTQPSM